MSNARGIEVYASTKQTSYSKESIYIGYQIEKTLCKDVGYESRGVKFANFQVLRETTSHCVSILLELGFLSNIDESSLRVQFYTYKIDSVSYFIIHSKTIVL